MSGLDRTKGILAGALIALVAALAVPIALPSAQAAPLTPLAGSNSQQWAYGGQHWVNTSVSFGNASFSSRAFFGWHVIFTATNTSPTTVQLEAQRTMAGSYFATYCVNGCTNPTVYGNLSIQGWASDTAFANLTTLGTVYVNGTATQAAALANASSRSAANLSESVLWKLNTPNSTHTVAASFHIAGASHANIVFSPALGLVPWNASKGMSWNSSSAFTASGGFSLLFSWSRTSLLGVTTSGHGNFTNQVAASGSVSLYGHDAGTIVLSNGQTVPVIVLVVVGPFDDEDGIVLVPHEFNLFSAGHREWDSLQVDGQMTATTKLDLSVDVLHHGLRFSAAASSYSATDSSIVTPATGGATPAQSAPPGPSTEVQAQPESVPQAQQSSRCLLGSCSGGTASALGAVPLGLLLVGLVVVAVAGTVGVVEYSVWSKKRRPGAPPLSVYSGPAAPPTPGSPAPTPPADK